MYLIYKDCLKKLIDAEAVQLIDQGDHNPQTKYV